MSCYQVFFSTETEDLLLALALLLDRTPDDLLTSAIEETVLRAAIDCGLKKIDKQPDQK
jgi:hypothetical protein